MGWARNRSSSDIVVAENATRVDRQAGSVPACRCVVPWATRAICLGSGSAIERRADPPLERGALGIGGRLDRSEPGCVLGSALEGHRDLDQELAAGDGDLEDLAGAAIVRARDQGSGVALDAVDGDDLVVGVEAGGLGRRALEDAGDAVAAGDDAGPPARSRVPLLQPRRRAALV